MPRPITATPAVEAAKLVARQFVEVLIAPAYTEEARAVFATASPDSILAMPLDILFDFAAVHVDGTARVQTVNEAANPRLYRLLKEFEALTGAKILQFYGSNETGALSRTTMRDDRPHRRTVRSPRRAAPRARRHT